MNSSGMPWLGSRILKEYQRFSIKPFTRVLNECVKQGIFPLKWKRTWVVAILKGAKMRYLTNIQPISLLPYPGKILENIVHKKLYSYLKENELLCPEQSGFRRN